MSAPETAAAPAPKPIPVVTDFLRLVRVLVSPTAVFEEQRERPTFWIPWLIVVVLMLAASYLSFPFTLAVARLGAVTAGRPFPSSAESIMKFSMIAAIPIVTLVMLLINAGILYLVLLGAGGEARYKGLMTVAVFGGLLGVLQILATYLVLTLRGPDGLQTMADYQVTFGLDLVLSADTGVPKFLVGLLRGISPFSVWGLVITAIGVRTMEKTSSAAAWTAAGVTFVFGVLMAAVFSGMGGPR